MPCPPRLLLLFVGLLPFLTGCRSVQDMVESGEYERGIAVAQRKLTGKEKKDPKLVAALEQAVNRANDRDVRRAEFLKSSNGTDWTEVHAVYANIQRRQDAIRPLLPLYDRDGRKANFRFVRAEDLVVEAEDRAADQLYQEALVLMEQGRAGDKSAARTAYATFGAVERYRPGYLDSRVLAAEAEQLGQVYVVVDVVNESHAFLPAGFEEELLRLRASDMDDQWRRYDLRPQPDRIYDYRARLVINAIDISPERVSERAYDEAAEVTDGEEYVLDDKGNVAKDSLGNDLKQPRRVKVQARIVEVLQQKNARVAGSMQLYDLRASRVVDEEDLVAEAIFEHYASTFVGDRRALSKQSRRRIGNRPVPFPTDEQLVLDAAGQLKPVLQERLAGSRNLL